MDIELKWTELKILIDNKKLKLQYIEDSQRYKLFASDSSLCYYTYIVKSNCDPAIILSEDAETEHANAESEFETSYKDSSNQPLDYRSSDGLIKIAPAKFVETLDFYVDGENGLVSLASGETKYSKTHYSFPYTLAGVDVRWANCNYGDYINFEVGVYTDLNDEATFITLNRFGNKYRLIDSGNRIFDVPTVKVIPPTITYGGYTLDVYMRATCYNAGTNASKVLINLIGWK